MIKKREWRFTLKSKRVYCFVKATTDRGCFQSSTAPKCQDGDGSNQRTTFMSTPPILSKVERTATKNCRSIDSTVDKCVLAQSNEINLHIRVARDPCVIHYLFREEETERQIASSVRDTTKEKDGGVNKKGFFRRVASHLLFPHPRASPTTEKFIVGESQKSGFMLTDFLASTVPSFASALQSTDINSMANAPKN